MARNMKPANSDMVREWANDTNWRDNQGRPVADRGRLPSGLIEAYNNAHRRNLLEYQPVPRGVSQPSVSRSQDSTPAPRSTRSNSGGGGTAVATRQRTTSAPAQRSTRNTEKATQFSDAGPSQGDLASALIAAGPGAVLTYTVRLDFPND